MSDDSPGTGLLVIPELTTPDGKAVTRPANCDNPRQSMEIVYEGNPCIYYPATGAVRDPRNGRIVANFGGRIDMHEAGRFMGERSAIVRKEALIEGLMKAGYHYRKGDPRGVLSDIVVKQIDVALEGGQRDSLEAAKWLFKLFEEVSEEGPEAPKNRIDIQMDKETMLQFLETFGREK